ncbi:MAG: glutamate racemase [Myxococcales bacterium]|nr:glutamate racemase [Myxococcales bacterium]
MTRADLPIGVFDSGLGGLTVVKAVRALLPGENILYLGDNARVPYGTRSPETIRRYATHCADFLHQRGLKMLVVACNTVSAVAIDALKERFPLPVLGVIEAGAKLAVQHTRNRIVGVIGTAGTVAANAYPRAIAQRDARVTVHQNPAPLLVPLAEEGWLEGTVPELAVDRYIRPLIDKDIDTLVLGCTHYPLLRSVIEQRLRTGHSAAHIVDSAGAMAAEVSRVLAEERWLRQGENGTLQCFVTDLPQSFGHMAERFLGQHISAVERVDI